MQARERDPLVWCLAVTAGFAALVLYRLAMPTIIYFDEVHYVPAARALLQLKPANAEHPPLAKELIALSIRLLGDTPFAWRLPSALLGIAGLFGFGRALWWASGRRFATIAGMVLLASDFAWFVESRIAVLDMAMAGFAMLALWMLAEAACLPVASLGRRRRRLALAGIALGLAMAAKWSVVPVAMLAGTGFAGIRLGHGNRRDAPPVPGIGFAEFVLWLGVVPLAVYWATFWPAFHYATGAVSPWDPIGWHRHMIALQDSVTRHHPYQTRWWQWVTDERGIWYLYQVVDGAQRGVLLLGNPLTMLAGLPALGWCVWAGFARRRADAAAVAALYAVSLGLWVIAAKPVQFYYHYLLAGTFLIAALALALDALWRVRGPEHWLAPVVVAGSVALFVGFAPILAAAALHHGPMSFASWMWLDSWR